MPAPETPRASARQQFRRYGQAVRAGIPAVGVAVVLAVSGCGDASSTTAPTKAQFAARADAICSYEARKLRWAAAFERASLASFDEVPRLIRQAVAIHTAADAKLESLPKPSGEGAAITRWLTARTIASTLELDTAEAPVGRASVAARDIRSALARARALVHALSRRYGFRICGASE